MSEEREYVLGTHDAELARLGFQHAVWAGPTAEAWEHGRFARGATILDVGCGPGYVTFDLANLVGPDGRVVAVDMSQRFVTHLRAEAERRGVHQVDARVEDLAELSQPEASVDGAFARWVLCFVPDPARVVGHVARALRPGAAFAVMDYAYYEGFRIAPAAPVFERVFGAVAGSFRAHGGDPNIGQRIPRLMHEAGLEVREVRPLVRVGRPGTALWEWPRTFFRIFLPTLVEAGSLSARDADEFFAVYDERSADPGAYFLSPPMVEVVGVKR